MGTRRRIVGDSHRLLLVTDELRIKLMICGLQCAASGLDDDPCRVCGVSRVALAPPSGPPNTRDQLRGAHDLALLPDDRADHNAPTRLPPPLVSCIALLGGSVFERMSTVTRRSVLSRFREPALRGERIEVGIVRLLVEWLPILHDGVHVLCQHRPHRMNSVVAIEALRHHPLKCFAG